MWGLSGRKRETWLPRIRRRMRYSMTFFTSVFRCVLQGSVVASPLLNVFVGDRSLPTQTLLGFFHSTWCLILPRCPKDLELHHFSAFSSPSLKNPFPQQCGEEAERKRHQCFVVPVLTVPFDPCLFVEASEGAVSVLERRNSWAFLNSAVLFSLHLRNNLWFGRKLWSFSLMCHNGFSICSSWGGGGTWHWIQVLQRRCLKAFAEALSGTNGETKAGKLIWAHLSRRCGIWESSEPTALIFLSFSDG